MPTLKRNNMRKKETRKKEPKAPNVNDYLKDDDGGLRFMKDSQAYTEQQAKRIKDKRKK